MIYNRTAESFFSLGITPLDCDTLYQVNLNYLLT